MTHLNPLEQSIIRTLAFFDIFETPLTKEEVFRFLWQPPKTDRGSVYRTLESMYEVELIHQKSSLYYLPTKDNHIEHRNTSYPIILRKLRLAVRATKIIRYIPHIRALFVCNTVATGSAKADSDIDVFIVIDDGRLWLTRFIVTSLLGLFGMRRTKRKIADKICLSFFVTTSGIPFEKIAIDKPDIYLAYWLSGLLPIYDPRDVEAQIKKENSWATALLPHAFTPTKPVDYIRVDDTKFSKIIKNFFEKTWGGSYGDLLNREAKKAQEIKMKLNTNSTLHDQNSNVIVNDTMMKFHENDRREHYRSVWEETVHKFIID
jgi:predicted nucleotidyltransferase